MRFAVLAAAALLLSGCYESAGLLLDAKAARQPIAAAQDFSTGSGEARQHVRLTPRKDGWYDYSEAKIGKNGREGAPRRYRVLLNDLTAANGYTLYVYGTRRDDNAAFMYGIVAVGSDGTWQSITPRCEAMNADPAILKADLAAAKAAGAMLTSLDDIETVCLFTSRQALMQAMTNLVHSPGFWDRVKKAAS